MSDKLKEVLIRNVGNDRECPRCRNSFIPNDALSKETFEEYQKLFETRKIDVIEVLNMARIITEINNLDLESIIFINNSKEIKPDKNTISKWKRLGLSNIDYIKLGFLSGDK